MATRARIAIGMAIGGMLGATLGIVGYIVAFRNDGDGTAELLLVFGALFGGVPGLVLGMAAGAGISRLVQTKPEDKEPRH